MEIFKKTVTVLAVALSFALTAAAQSEIRVEAPNLVAGDEQFNITFIVEGDEAPSDFQWSVPADFKLVWGPQKGTSRSVSIVNGKRTSTSQSTYIYVLMPLKAGSFTLPQPTATVKGRTITSKPITIEVVSGGSSSQSQGNSSQQGGQSSQGNASSQASQTGEIPQSDLYLRLSLSRTSVVVGENVTASLKLYQRVNIAGFEDARFPTFNGFWSQELQAPSNIEFHRENINNEIYNVALLRSWNLIAQQAGDISIDPAELVCLVNVRSSHGGSRSIFDAFFEDEYHTIRKRVVSQPATVHVSRLPAGAPASFGGGVGTFSIKASLSRDSLKTHDAASLSLVVSGGGNISLLEAPKVNFPPDFEVYDPKTTDNVSSGGLQGSKTFEYPFIPRSWGEFTIDPIEYSYYDVNSKRYVTLRTDPITIKVARGEGVADTPASGQLVQGVTRRDVKDLGSDIRYIRTKAPSFKSLRRPLLGSGLFWVLLGAIVAAFAAVLYGVKAHRKAAGDVQGTRKRAASSLARKRLSRAGEFLEGDLYSAFYEELHRALLGYASDALTLSAESLDKENISAALLARGVDASVAEDFTGLLSDCEYARYSSAGGHEQMGQHYKKALEVISTIDSAMKRHKNVPSGAAMLVALALLCLPAGVVKAAADYPDSLWRSGVEAYEAGDWDSARSCWEQIDALGLAGEDLYFNLGNSCFKQGDCAHSILYYEKALKLKPSMSDARHNLEFARDLVQDRIEEVPEFFLKQWWKSLAFSLSSNVWAVLFLLLFAVAAALALLFALSRSQTSRRWGFYAGLAALLLALLSLGLSITQVRADSRNQRAVILSPVVSVKSSPSRESSKDLFVLHEGTTVKVLEIVGQWYNIELPDGRQGWILEDGIGVI